MQILEPLYYVQNWRCSVITKIIGVVAFFKQKSFNDMFHLNFNIFNLNYFWVINNIFKIREPHSSRDGPVGGISRQVSKCSANCLSKLANCLSKLIIKCSSTWQNCEVETSRQVGKFRQVQDNSQIAKNSPTVKSHQVRYNLHITLKLTKVRQLHHNPWVTQNSSTVEFRQKLPTVFFDGTSLCNNFVLNKNPCQTFYAFHLFQNFWITGHILIKFGGFIASWNFLFLLQLNQAHNK